MASFMTTESSQTEMVSFLEIERMLIQAVGEISGVDMDGREYKGIEHLWNVELSNTSPAGRSPDADDSDDEDEDEDKMILSNATTENNQYPVENQTISEADKGKRWYDTAYDFWEDEKNCPVTDDGVLGGYGKITPEDVKGIGRVAKHLLLHRFTNVDIIEQSPRLLAAAPQYIGEMSSRATCIVQKLQDFAPVPNSYDVIWIQWVLGHLHDHDVIRFYQRCAAGLRPGGVIILKDNCSIDWTFVVDKEDNSVARCREYIRLLIKLAGLEIVVETLQTDFPTELYPVTTFAIGRPVNALAPRA